MPHKILLPPIAEINPQEFRLRLLNLLQSAVFTDAVTLTAAGTTSISFLPSVVLCDATLGNQTIALPRVTDFTSGTFFIKKIDSSTNTVTVDGNAADVIDDAATFVLSVQYDSLILMSNGSKWHVLARGAVANSLVEKIEIAKAGALVGTRKRVNLIEGVNVTLTVADNAGSDRVDVTVAAAGAAGAPSTVEYLVALADAGLSAERVTTDTATVTWDHSVAGQAKANVPDDAITNAKLANMASARFKARVTAAAGDPEDLTGTQATTLLDIFTAVLKGLAPASGGGSANFLRADATWAVPPGIVTTPSIARTLMLMGA